MSEYTVYRMVAIKVEADNREEAIRKTRIFNLIPSCVGSSDYSWNLRDKVISAIKTKEDK